MSAMRSPSAPINTTRPAGSSGCPRPLNGSEMVPRSISMSVTTGSVDDFRPTTMCRPKKRNGVVVSSLFSCRVCNRYAAWYGHILVH